MHYSFKAKQSGRVQRVLLDAIGAHFLVLTNCNNSNHHYDTTTMPSRYPTQEPQWRPNNVSKPQSQFYPGSRIHLLLLLATALCLSLCAGPASCARPAETHAAAGLGPQTAGSGGPSLCPLVSACQCKWAHGKQSASCERRQLQTIPGQLPQDTQILEMNGNPLGHLPAHIFQDRHLTNLQRLFLSECRISSLAEQSFAQLTNLVELDLSHNSIQQVPNKPLEQLRHSLRRLSLAHNPIEMLEGEAFVALAQLNTLDLSHCQLSQLKPGAFLGLSQLKELKLHDNQLTQLPVGALAPLGDYLTLELFGNPWHCDCELRQSIEWMARRRVQQSIPPTCASPQRHRDIRWPNVKPEEFICPPLIVNHEGEKVVGAGSNVSLSCTARGSPPLTFIWYQDEKNIPQTRANLSEPPASTKLLEERRYEIVEELDKPGQPNTTTSTLYLYNLQLSDTSLFLCWVENAAGSSISNYSLLVNDSPPATLPGDAHLSGANSFLRSLGIGQSEAQLGIVSVGFVAVLISAVIFLLTFRHGSSKSSQSSAGDLKQIKAQHSVLSASNKFSQPPGGHHGGQRGPTLAESEQDDSDADERSSSTSGSSCNKKVISSSDLDGFIEHLRSGIISMDYHSMSPVIQFNNAPNEGGSSSTKPHQLQQQDRRLLGQPSLQRNHRPEQLGQHHLPSASNTSSLQQYYAGNGGSGSAGELSPTHGARNMGFTANLGQPITNCDLQHQLHEMAPATNTTTTSYTSDYQSGYSDEPANMPPVYFHDQQQPFAGHMYPVQAASQTIMVAGPMRPSSMILQAHQPHQQASRDSLVLQGMMHSRHHLPNQRPTRTDSGFHIL